jgi:hypothetical protein
VFGEPAGQQPVDQFADLFLAEVQQMTGHIERKPVNLVRSAQPACFLFFLDDAMGSLAQMKRGTQSS